MPGEGETEALGLMLIDGERLEDGDSDGLALLDVDSEELKLALGLIDVEADGLRLALGLIEADADREAEIEALGDPKARNRLASVRSILPDGGSATEATASPEVLDQRRSGSRRPGGGRGPAA